ncbi:hybrid sensor histidine kinase/response regulator [Sphingosinicella rhizophila]|uniref:histidine kinase n=1 Tax=Sphingosinicella rhizophila TaxID=3050082 RepID=A0ABU3Q2S5_9SPHN|nr:response regulator [Sphingosinicella sp. GR2756]MDT9597705.1 response regulator [Sphingosinicella sp. GR2756]
MASIASGGPARSGVGSGLFVIFGAAAVSAGLLLWVMKDLAFAAAFLAVVIGFGVPLMLLRARTAAAADEPEPARLNLALLRSGLDTGEAAIAIIDDENRLLCANGLYEQWFGGLCSPLDLPSPEPERGRLAEAAVAARRDGSAMLQNIFAENGPMTVELRTAGLAERYLLWKFTRAGESDVGTEARQFVSGEGGARLSQAGVMAVLANGAGHLVAANRAFSHRALGEGVEEIAGISFVDLLVVGDEGQFHFAREGKAANPLRIIQVPMGKGEEGPVLFLLLDDLASSFSHGANANVNALLEILPLGLAVADRDGRFVYLNSAFRRAAGLSKNAKPTYPGDLVVDEDKAAVSDSVRRFARGPSMSGDLAVRLKAKPDEPIALTVAGARGLGEAAVLLSLKDNSEEDKLKRQVAQATKMQAVGQLAGGVAHDFNNILTAIIGHCDLMLMRHTPGDSDYDDIQQIRSNSNRAAGLTRQLLAFSRQQTLRPQVLQLPDIISEVSTLLKRLLGETVKLQVKHGRNLGPVRADPGQLEQVIVNLAVNARDAMEAKGEGQGILTIQTYGVSIEDVRRMGTEILPVADYTALRVSDTGTGIPRHLLAKIFEPFFTTKEVGKGTGLGLSTVYGIVKQSGGFIFAESLEGEGTSFVIYLPVHRAEIAKSPRKARETAGELWGTGTILLVEDEATVRAVAERALSRHGYTVLVAENGEAALEILARESNIDLMISDVVMPTMDGPTTAREARKTHPDLPILFISGYAEEQLRQSIDLDRVGFLAKPFSVQKLAEVTRDTLLAK